MRWRWCSPFITFSLTQIAVSPTLSMSPIQGWRPFKPTSVPTISISKIRPISTDWRICKPPFISGMRNPSSEISGVISSPATRRGPIPIHKPSWRTVDWGARIAMMGRRAGITPPRTPWRCISRPFALVTVLSSRKVQVVTQGIRAHPITISWPYIWIASRQTFSSNLPCTITRSIITSAHKPARVSPTTIRG